MGPGGGRTHRCGGGGRRVGIAGIVGLTGDDGRTLGFDLFFAKDGAEIIVNAISVSADNGRIHAFSTTWRGSIGEGSAERSIYTTAPIGSIEPWDGDGDGEEDLVAQHQAGVAFFQGPWESGPFESFDAQWVDTCGFECGIGDVLSNLGDVTGDGTSDLGFSAPMEALGAERAGRAYVLAAMGEGGLAADIPIQLRGELPGDGMGFAMEGADIDGDGARDLVLSASGVLPGLQQGSLLVYRGPLSEGSRTLDDADVRLYGQYGLDLFVRSIEVLSGEADIDGDGRDDLALGAPGWPAGRSQGAIYLVLGGALLP